MSLKIFAFAPIIVLLGAGCLSNTTMIASAPAADRSKIPAWTTIAPDLSRFDCSADVCGARLILFHFAKDKFNWHFAASAAPMTVESWARSLPKATFVANGVYFDEKFQPTGLLKTSNTLVNDRKYDLDKSGLLELSPAVAVIDTATKKLAPYSDTGIDVAKMTEAGQSFPLLIKNGAPVNSFKNEDAARRTVVGTDTNGDVYVGAVPEDSVSFPALVSLLEKTGVKWNNVLNLDGGTSTGFSVHAGSFEETMNSIVQVPNVIVAERK
jgi:uncharacterized protein YigE (DUF2233 family)